MPVPKEISDLFFYFDNQTYRASWAMGYVRPEEIKKALVADAEWFLILAGDLAKDVTVEELVDDYWKRI